MGSKSLLQKVKELLNLSGTSQPAADSEPTEADHPGSAAGDEAGVTVEREPEKSQDDTGTGGGRADDTSAGSDADPSATAAQAEDREESGAEPVDAVKGIGPVYAERLSEHGIETVIDLADADAEDVAEAAQTSKPRVTSWIERAQNR
jgi:predicted flap endonuclease-1-like 5' DNA nuclease